MAKPPAPTPKPLTPKQQRFVEEYLVDLNATQAAIRAGYSAKAAAVQGARMLANANVAAAVRAGRAVVSERAQFGAEDVLRELAILLRSDVRDFEVANDGSLTLREGAPDSAWRAVAAVKHKIIEIPQKDGEPMFRREIEFKLWDKNSAIDKAMKHLGLLAEGANITLNQTNNTQVNNVWKFGDKEIVF